MGPGAITGIRREWEGQIMAFCLTSGAKPACVDQIMGGGSVRTTIGEVGGICEIARGGVMDTPLVRGGVEAMFPALWYKTASTCASVCGGA